jgi:hypothetical protein
MAYHLKAGPKKCLRDGHLKAGRSGFRMYTVHRLRDNTSIIQYLDRILNNWNLCRPDIEYPVIGQNGRSITKLVRLSALDRIEIIEVKVYTGSKNLDTVWGYARLFFHC